MQSKKAHPPTALHKCFIVSLSFLNLNGIIQLVTINKNDTYSWKALSLEFCRLTTIFPKANVVTKGSLGLMDKRNKNLNLM